MLDLLLDSLELLSDFPLEPLLDLLELLPDLPREPLLDLLELSPDLPPLLDDDLPLLLLLESSR